MKFTTKLYAMIGIGILSSSVFAQERILSIGGDVTEIIYALNAEQQLIGRDSTSESPEQAKKLPNIGYMRQLNTEGILALKPTHIIATQVAQPAIVLEQIKATGVKIDQVPFNYSIDKVPEKINTVGRLLHKEKEATALAQQFETAIKAINQSPTEVKILFLLNHAGMNQMAAGANTGPDTAIKFIGAKNAMGNSARFVPISQEGVIAANPDLLVVTRLGLEHLGSVDKLWALPGVTHTNAGKQKQYVVVDDIAFMAFGLGLPQELQKIRQAVDKVRK